LADTVVDATSHALFEETATGFAFEHADADALWWAVNRAIELYRRPPIWWEKLVHTAMSRDFDWQVSAARYQELYRFALDNPAATPIPQP
jgi:starch synthase